MPITTNPRCVTTKKSEDNIVTTVNCFRTVHDLVTFGIVVSTRLLVELPFKFKIRVL